MSHPAAAEFSDFDRRLADAAAQVERALARWLDDTPAPGEIARPPRLMAAMRHAALGGGKRLRPFLMIESAVLSGAAREGALEAACALECVHCYSLVHDDLPAMDDDDLRRGRPTVHKAFDEATAILAGDGLLTLAFAIMADPVVHPDPAVRIELSRELAVAAGAGGMAGGQMFDLLAETAQAPPARAWVERMQAMKTGALIRFACEGGAVLGGADANARARLRRFGERLGLVFQISDDLLDLQGDAARLGKAAGKDAARNKATLPALLGAKEAEAVRDACAGAAARELEALGPEADGLRAALQFACARAH